MTHAQLMAWALDGARTVAELQALATHYALPIAGLARANLVVSIVTHLATLPPAGIATYIPPATPVVPLTWVHKLVTLFLGLQLVADIIWLVVVWPFVAMQNKREIVIFLIGFSLLATIAGIVYAMIQQPGGRHTRRGIHGLILGGTSGITLEVLAIVVVMFGLLTGWPLAIVLGILGIMSISADATATIKHVNYTP